MTNQDDAEFITPPNNLKNKVKYNTGSSVDLEMLEHAEGLIADMKDNYIDWAKDDVEKLQNAFNVAKETRTVEDFKKVFEISHDMKGQGGSFGYDLVTVIGNNLCRFIESREDFGDNDVEVARVHVDTIRLVITNEMEGDGGEQGRQVLNGLRAVINKYVGEEEKIEGF